MLGSTMLPSQGVAGGSFTFSFQCMREYLMEHLGFSEQHFFDAVQSLVKKPYSMISQYGLPQYLFPVADFWLARGYYNLAQFVLPDHAEQIQKGMPRRVMVAGRLLYYPMVCLTLSGEQVALLKSMPLESYRNPPQEIPKMPISGIFSGPQEQKQDDEKSDSAAKRSCVK